MTWLRACSVEDLEDGDAVQVEVEPPIAVFNVEGAYYALNDTCTHDKSSLADGYIDGDQVECAWHFAKFSIKTGEVLSPPATVPLCTYQVRVEGDDVMVHVSD